MTIAAEVLDFYDDSRHELMTKVAMPPRLHNVHMGLLTPDQRDRLSDNEFGLIVLTKRASVFRKFPVNDPGNAWMSAQYFQQTHDKLAFPARFVAARFIKQACDAYGVPSSNRIEGYAARTDDDVTTNVFVEGSESSWMLRKLAQRELEKNASAAAAVDASINLPDESFALVIQNGDGAVIRKYAMPDGEHVKTAAQYFDKYAMQLPPEYRHRFAISVQNRAEELGVDVTGHAALSKWASTDWNRHVIAHLEQRRSLLPRNPGAGEILDKLAASLGETTPQDMATALQTFDEATGLTKYYDRGLTDPYASTMGKVAYAWSSEVDGQTMTEEQLRKVAESKKLAGYLGDTFARQFAVNPVEIFDSLPSPEKILIKQIAFGEA